jgi:hypothetical protein
MPNSEVQQAWAAAFARQAVSDFEAREQLLRNAELPECHQLHYLQMAFEKAAKAHLIAGGSDAWSLQSSHAYIAKVVPIIVRDALGRTPGGIQAWVIDAVRRLARRIELLHPQVDHGGSIPTNCEYPWTEGGSNVVAPVEHRFGLNLHAERAAITMIKEVRARAAELA